MVKVSRAPGTKGRGREQRRGRGEGDHCEMLADDARLKQKTRQGGENIGAKLLGCMVVLYTPTHTRWPLTNRNSSNAL